MSRALDFRRAVGTGWIMRLAAISVALASGVALGNEAGHPPRILSVRVGFADQYKLGSWTPVDVSVRAGDEPLVAELALTVPDGDGVLSRVTAECGPLRLAAGQEVTRRVFVKFGQAADELRVALRSAEDGALLAQRSLVQGSDELPSPLPIGRELLVMVGSVDAHSDARGAVLTKDWQAAVARLPGFELLPERWYGYEGVDLVVLSTGDAEIYRQLSAARVAALSEWIELGGRLLLAVGSTAADVLAPEAPLARFAPGKFSEIIQRPTGALETFAGTSERLESGEGALRLGFPKLVDVRGRIEAYDGNHPRDLPIVVRSPFGLGEVIFVGLDLDRPPFSTWRGRVNFIDRLLDRPQQATEASDSRVLGHVTELGYTDLAGQLHTALAQFTGVQLVPFAAVAALVVIYLLAIGPFDYLFLKKIVGRMELTWLTFSLLVLAFSGGIYALAYWLKGEQLRLNQIDLVDLDAESGVLRGTSWSTLYSPRIDTFDLTLRTEPVEIVPQEPPRVLLSWMAVPGSGLAGVGRAAGAAMFTQPYDFAPRLDGLERLPIAMWSTRSLLARWWAKAPSPLTARLSEGSDHMLGGTLEFPDNWPLTDAVLIYDRWAYPLERNPAGTTLDVEKHLEPQTVETYFRHAGQSEEKSGRSGYDRTSTDLAHVLETMMFHRISGGELYTALVHRAQGYVDLSNQLRLGRAVLLARAATPAAVLTRPKDHETSGETTDLENAEGQRVTFYRLVLPVASSSGN